MTLPFASSHVRPATLVALALAFACATAAAACGGEVVSVGRGDQTLKKRADGGATGDGSTCSWDDAVSSDGNQTSTGSGPYAVGDSFPSLDGCNSCSCTAQGIACTQRACAPADAGAAGSCSYDGKTYAAGQSFPSSDGCNTCTCNAGGVACTEKACAKGCKDANGTTHAHGDTWQAACNTCSCFDGQAQCTAMACN